MDDKCSSKSRLVPAIILSIGFIICAIIIATTLRGIKRMDNTITVTGSTKTQVSSDQVRWIITISYIAPTLNEGYTKMGRDLSKVREFLASVGIDDRNVEVSEINTSQPWLYSERSDRFHYQFNQEIVVTLNDVNKIEEVASKVYDLVGQGVNIVSNNVEFYYSKLPELRISLLNDAMVDAKNRAEVIAKSTGRKVGKIKSARMGVVQVMAPGSVEISDYGTYNTRSKEKEVMVTVQATFYLR
ncbi:MAG TPA: SIMPL domain-containing protein [Candidatus Hydrothermia bacterium]|nr:SIMPL domain-containing protein [Candidatus Hydrothermae bacterium]MDD3648773.1 SIMPL domain-containing protein [Candidatus Hydrothermia bacterium]MDD5572896.1 SIMPL domain-containing protein [Candidatus Hydrothermia bacterium]HOP33039.1 SIMPL domain-containing protein [Candidatus Hydrothermia bacterium]HRD22448.1 SIMPL domain-containing protein [Candidatus Hydrothermia bacterium]